MFIVVKKKTLLIAFFALLTFFALAGAGIYFSKTPVFSPKKARSVVIDAGHGGADKGVVGKNGLVEAELNLTVSKLLAEKLSDGFYVRMTRETADGLYGDSLEKFKARDFAARKKFIQDIDPDLVISIHANKFPQSKDRRGIQVFYNKASEEGKNLAVALQNRLNDLNEKYVGKTFSPLSGEYFMLNCTKKPSVIIECGFLSNEEDEALLSTSSYLNELTDAITIGVQDFCR